MAYDVDALRARIPALASGIAFFDGPGGSQTPAEVADAIRDALCGPLSNRGRVTAAERRADDLVTGARAALGDLLAVPADTVVFGRSMTALTYELARTLAASWGPGDEVVVSDLDHDANVRPWIQAAERAGATVRWAHFDPATGELGVEDVAAVLGPRTRLVAVTGASNLIGTVPPVAAIAEAVHAAGALLFVDGVHLTAHAAIDVPALGADFFACSPYKFLGPHCGVLTGRAELLAGLRPDKLLPSSDAVPERFELGTLPYELLAGAAAAVEVLASLGSGDTRRARLVDAFAAIEQHEGALLRHLEGGLAQLPGITVHSRAARRTPTLLLTVADRPARAAYEHLATLGVNAPAGSFYAIEPSRRLGLGDAGGLRVGLAPYTDAEDVDRLLAGLGEFATSTP